MEDIFKCTFCEQGFNLKAKVPKMLTQCGHSICLQCLQLHLTQRKNIRCEIDDQIITTENTTEKDYPQNLALIQYLEQKQPNSLDQSLENIDCRQYFASKQKESENLSISTDKKQFLEKIKVMEEFIQKRSMSDSFSEEEAMNGFCQTHNISQDVFCKTCEEWICHKCGLFGGHKDHQMINGENFKEQANLFCKEVTVLLSKLEREENYLKDEFIEIFFASKSSKNLKKLHKQVKDAYKIAAKQLKNEKEEVLRKIENSIQDCEEILHEKIDDQLEKFSDRSSNLKRSLKTMVSDINRKKNKEKIYLEIQKNDSKILEYGKNLVESLQIDVKILKRRISKFFDGFDVKAIEQSDHRALKLTQPDLDIIKGKKESFNGSFKIEETAEDQQSIITLGKKEGKFPQIIQNDNFITKSSSFQNLNQIQSNSNPFKNSTSDTNSQEKVPRPNPNLQTAFKKNLIQQTQKKQNIEKQQSKKKEQIIKKVTIEQKGQADKKKYIFLKKDYKLNINNDQLMRCKTSHKSRNILPAKPIPLQKITKKSLLNHSSFKRKDQDNLSLKKKLEIQKRKITSSSQRRIKTSHRRTNSNQYLPLFNTVKKSNQVLNFDDSNLKDSFLSKFNEYLKESENVKVLILSNNKFTDKGVQKICEIVKGLNIQTLDLSGNLLTHKSIAYLRILCEKNQSIKRIVFENSSLSKVELEDLTAEFKLKGIDFQC